MQFQFLYKMIHPDTELRFITDSIGFGVFATKHIPEGTITYIKDSLEIEISPNDFLTHSHEMQQVIEKYSYIDERGFRVISWDIAKYVNHCCQCNTISTGYGFEMAVRDILPGEQLTDEYGIFNIKDEMQVTCGKDGCRKWVRPEDFDRYYPIWDEKIKHALPKIFHVSQPLMFLMSSEIRQELNEFFTDPQKYKSVYSLKFDRAASSALYISNGRE